MKGSRKTLQPGTKLGNFEVTELLGVGGMGEVYRATDSKLEREVAIKVLPEEFSRDNESLQRFKREARVLASTNHPNIAVLHGLESQGDTNYLVMELVPGKTLEERLESGPIPIDEALSLFVQIAEGLEAAHEQGIVHRDLKPANIKITEEGMVKILDFGLAKTTTMAQGAEAQSTTLSVGASPNEITIAGTILGTPAYMSPEQARGEKLDARSDLFSLGVVLYHATTSKLPFDGSTQALVFDGILNRAPIPPSQLNSAIPVVLERVISKCLEKDRDLRCQSASDLRADLKRLRRDLGHSVTLTTAQAAPHASPSHFWRPAALTLGTVLVAAIAWSLVGPRAPAPAVPLLHEPTFERLTDQPGQELFPSLSPDGGSFVYTSRASGNWDIYRQRVGGKKLDNLTEGCTDDDTQPAFSPRGDRISFRSERLGGGIFVMGATGESVRRVTESGYNPSWSPDGRELVFATESAEDPASRFTTSQLWAVDVTTGTKRLITEGDAVQPQWSPEGDRITFWAQYGGQRDIWVIGAHGGEPRAVTDDLHLDWNPVWSPDGGDLFFSSDRGGSMNLWRIPLDKASGEPLGPPAPLTTPSLYSAHISISRDGTRLAYAWQNVTSTLQRVEFDPDAGKVIGSSIAVTQGSRLDSSPEFSPSADSLAFQLEGVQEDICVVRTDGTDLRHLTDDLYKDRLPRWSPDGERIAFYSNRTGSYQIWSIRTDGSGLEQISGDGEEGEGAIHPIWSPDGLRLLYTWNRGPALRVVDLSKPLEAQQSSEPFFQSAAPPGFNAWSWSPDGKWIAGFQADAAGKPTGVTAYSFDSGAFERLTDFGARPIWLGDSRRLLFEHSDSIYLVDRESREAKLILSVAPHEIGNITISPDDRMICYGLWIRDADVWMATSTPDE